MAAVAVLYLPREHIVHAAEPFTSLKPPTSHASHSAPSGPVYPLLQVQLVSCLLPTRENVCAGQSLHVDSEIWAVSAEYVPLEHSEHGAEPFTSLYVPATQAAHCIPSGPVYPLLQVQLVSIELPSGEYVCVGHSLHVASEIAASNVLYLP